MSDRMYRTDVTSYTRDYSRMERRLKILVQNVQIAYVKDKEAFVENCRQINERWKEATAISRILRDLKSGITYPSRKLESMNRIDRSIRSILMRQGFLGLVKKAWEFLREPFSES